MDITKLPLLATLEVLLRERSVRETARLLGVSPSTVSRHLAQLRELVGEGVVNISGIVRRSPVVPK
ncbi:MAG: helix-turn-helix domain-containing protein [Bradymonadia bacterium]